MLSNLPVGLFIIPFFAALLSTAAGLLVRGSSRIVTLAALAGTTGLAIAGAQRVLIEGTLRTELGGWAPPLGIEMILDPLAAFMAVIVSTVSLVVLFSSKESIDKDLEGRQTFFYSTALLLISGMIGLVLAGDLFNLFVHLEIASLSACALVACGSRGAPRAGLRYLVMGSLGASLYLLGVGFLYAAVGSLNMADVAARIQLDGVNQHLVLFSAVLILVGLCVKAGLFPLHGWMPDAYSLSPNPSSSLMAPLVTKVAAYSLFRILFFVFGPAYLQSKFILTETLLWGGALAMVFGGVLALKQNNLRRMFAYSSVAQIGIVFVGMALVSDEGSIGSILHLLNDALMKGALFLVATVLVLRYGITEVKDLNGLRGRSRLLSATILIAGLSLIGVPPLAGFFGKWYVLSAALQAGRWEVAGFLILGSLATVAYVFRLLEQIYFSGGEQERKDDQLRNQRFVMEETGAFLFAVTIIFVGIYNEQIVSRFVMTILSGLEL